MKRILVTGAAGFIGQHLIQFYTANPEIWVVGVDIVPCPESLLHQNHLSWHCGDLADDTPKTFEAIGSEFDVIFHCAGSASVGFSIEYPTIDFDRNTRLLQNVLWELYRRSFKGVVLFVSSAGVYGNQSILKLEESLKPKPISPYGLNKLLCEEICRYFIEIKSMDIRIARVFSAYGNGLSKQLLWDMFQKWRKYGEIALFGSGEEGRDFIHVKDIIQAFSLIVERGDPDIYNVGNGQAVKIETVAEIYRKLLGLTEEKVYFTGKTKEGDPDILESNNQKLISLGYRRSITIEAGIEDYLKWTSTVAR